MKRTFCQDCGGRILRTPGATHKCGVNLGQFKSEPTGKVAAHWRCLSCGVFVGKKTHRCRHTADGLTKDQRSYRKRRNHLALPAPVASPTYLTWVSDLVPPQCEG